MKNELVRLRKKIEKLDTVIVRAISARLDVSKKIGKLKAKAKLPITDLAREKQQLKFFIKLAKKHKLSAKALLQIFKAIISESKRVQKYAKKS